MKKVLLLALASVTLFSCSSVKKSRTAKTMDIIGPGVLHLPVVADLDISNQKATGTVIGRTGNSVELIKLDAIADVLKKTGSDVLIEPVYDIETTGSRITVTVSGFPAKYKNFRQMVAADTSLFKLGILRKPATAEPVAVKKRKNGGMVLAGIGTAAALIGVGIATSGL